MSKIGDPSNLGGVFKPIITNATYKNLKEMSTSGVSINLYNAFIISVPQDSQGEDIEGYGSIWMTDSNGQLYQLTDPIDAKAKK